MITAEFLNELEKQNLASIALKLEPQDITLLFELLSEKDDNLRYKSFLLLQSRSENFADVYPYWDAFVDKLNNDNSYQRSIGLMLIAENVRWDEQKKFNALADQYLALCDDEKPVTVRQCIQSLVKIVPFNPDCIAKVVDKLIGIDLMQRKDTQRKLLLTDILTVLLECQKIQPQEKVDRYICEALTGGILDEKTRKNFIAQYP
ncbi:MAG: hypothetical protein HPY72_07270 [Anaerolineae bacterium]|nr:hypothetical protein [Anaerolineae bacterium]